MGVPTVAGDTPLTAEQVQQACDALAGIRPQTISFTTWAESVPFVKKTDLDGVTDKAMEMASKKLGEAAGKAMDNYWKNQLFYEPQSSYRYANDWGWKTFTTDTTNLTIGAKQETDMAKSTPRTLYQVAIVNKKDDAIDIQVLVAESQQDARDEILRNPEVLPAGAKAKDYDIVFLAERSLSPRVEK
jgi:hypothetical protein